MALAKRSPTAMALTMKHARERAKKAAMARKHSAIAAVAAGGLGYAEGKGMKLPTAGALNAPTTYGIAALAATFFLKGSAQQTAQSVADGLLSVSSHAFGFAQGQKDAGK